MLNQTLFSRLAMSLLFVTLLWTAACSASLAGSQTDHNPVSHVDEEEDHDHNTDHPDIMRVPNEGAVIRLLAPLDGTTFKAGEEVVVKIEVENFTLGDGNHWHVYVDGSSWGMVMGQNTEQVLRGLDRGQHEIAVYLSVSNHDELAEGDTVTITVE